MPSLEFLRSYMDIGGIKLENPFISAPLAGVSDSAMRQINRSFGASLLFSEMISGKGLKYNNKNTEELLAFTEREEPIAYQIFGSEPDVMGETARTLRDRNNKIIDINMGCPVPKIVKNGEGSALLKDKKRVYEIVKSVVAEAGKPVTVKIRLGWDEKNINFLDIAKAIQEAGASGITLHARTREAYYSGRASWQAIKELKEAVNIAVIGNGDVFSGVDAIKLMEFTKCDMVMIGRGMLGNPWIFKECVNVWKNREKLVNSQLIIEENKPSIEEKLDMIIFHLELLTAIKGEVRAVKEMRKHIAWYTKGIVGSNIFRKELNELHKSEDVVNKIKEYKEFLKN